MSDFIKPSTTWIKKNVAIDRQREKVPKLVLDRVKKELDKLQVSFKRETLDAEYFWGWCPDGRSGTAVEIKLPVIEVLVP